jgi:hypothetical protein
VKTRRTGGTTLINMVVQAPLASSLVQLSTGEASASLRPHIVITA